MDNRVSECPFWFTVVFTSIVKGEYVFNVTFSLWKFQSSNPLNTSFGPGHDSYFFLTGKKGL